MWGFANKAQTPRAAVTLPLSAEVLLTAPPITGQAKPRTNKYLKDSKSPGGIGENNKVHTEQERTQKRLGRSGNKHTDSTAMSVAEPKAADGEFQPDQHQVAAEVIEDGNDTVCTSKCSVQCYSWTMNGLYHLSGDSTMQGASFFWSPDRRGHPYLN